MNCNETHIFNDKFSCGINGPPYIIFARATGCWNCAICQICLKNWSNLICLYKKKSCWPTTMGNQTLFISCSRSFVKSVKEFENYFFPELGNIKLDWIQNPIALQQQKTEHLSLLNLKKSLLNCLRTATCYLNFLEKSFTVFGWALERNFHHYQTWQ